MSAYRLNDTPEIANRVVRSFVDRPSVLQCHKAGASIVAELVAYVEILDEDIGSIDAV